MVSQKYYIQAFVAVGFLQDVIGGPGTAFSYLEEVFKRQIAEKGYGPLSRPVVHVHKPDPLTWTPEDCVKVSVVGRVVPIQRL